jgi:hypothetical protein
LEGIRTSYFDPAMRPCTKAQAQGREKIMKPFVIDVALCNACYNCQIARRSMRRRLYGLIAVALFMVFPGALCLAGTSLSAVTQPSKNDAKQQENPYAKAEITTKIIPSVNNTFGYDILLGGKPLVHQPSIPGLPGNEGFTTKEAAQSVADLVVKKIRNNEMPPTVTMENLKALGVLK